MPVTDILGPFMDSSEDVIQLPVKKNATRVFKVIYSVLIENVEPTDIVQALCHFEVTNNNSFRVAVSHALIRTDSPTKTEGVKIWRPNVENLAANVQHHQIRQLAAFDANVPAGSYYYNVIADAFYWSTVPAGAKIEVEQNYGRLEIIVIKRT